jgi:alkylhydroperoxidase family enzyme
LQQGLDEDVAVACALADFQHPDPRTRAALRYARALVKDTTDDRVFDEVYAELHRVFDDGEIIELG